MQAQGRGRKCRYQGLWNAREAVGDRDQNVADTAGLQVVEDLLRLRLTAPTTV